MTQRIEERYPDIKLIGCHSNSGREVIHHPSTPIPIINTKPIKKDTVELSGLVFESNDKTIFIPDQRFTIVTSPIDIKVGNIVKLTHKETLKIVFGEITIISADFHPLIALEDRCMKYSFHYYHFEKII